MRRFRFELFEWIFGRYGTKFMVLHSASQDPTEHLTEDLLAIVTVFSARAHGMYKYKRALERTLEEGTGTEVYSSTEATGEGTSETRTGSVQKGADEDIDRGAKEGTPSGGET